MEEQKPDPGDKPRRTTCAGDAGCAPISGKTDNLPVKPDPHALENIARAGIGAGTLNRALSALDQLMLASRQAKALQGIIEEHAAQETGVSSDASHLDPEQDDKLPVEGKLPKPTAKGENDPKVDGTKVAEPNDSGNTDNKDVTDQTGDVGTEVGTTGSERASDFGHQPLPIMWNFGPKEKKELKAAAAKDDPPAEPEKTIYSEGSFTVITLTGPHAGMKTEAVAKNLERALKGKEGRSCNLGYSPYARMRQNKYADMIILRGAQWAKADIAAVLRELEFEYRTFVSLQAMRDAGFYSRRLVDDIDYEMSERRKHRSR